MDFTMTPFPDGVQIEAGERLLRIAGVGAGILRINETRRRAFLNQPSEIVVRQGGHPCAVTQSDAAVVVDAGQIRVRMDRKYGNLTFYDAAGRVLLDQPRYDGHLFETTPVWVNEFDQSAQIEEKQSVDGARADAQAFTPRHVRDAYQLKINFLFDRDEGLYGLGSHEEGYGNLRGRRRNLFQYNMKACVPVLVSTKGYGVLFDFSCLMVFHDDPDGSYLWADCADELDYYVFAGGDFDGVMGNYRALTGETPMLPRWAFGYFQSKQRYQSFQELQDVAARYRALGVGLDCIVQDWRSWPEPLWGQKSFCPVRFAQPEKNIAKLHEMDVHLMLSVWPNMTGDGENRMEMLRQGVMLGNRSTYDAFDPKGRALYWKQANEGLFSKGLDAWWCDCTEPFEADWDGAVRAESHERIAKNTAMFKKYLDPAKINAYSLMHSKGIYQGQRNTTDEKRVVNLTRSSYAGQHRYATITWSGDVTAKWETLRRHIPEGCNFTATGEPYWSTDAGGFFVRRARQWFWRGDFDGGAADLGFRELYVRWLWYSVFLPMMRSHGDDTPREIWNFGNPGEPFFEAIRSAIQMRYALVPYLYSLCARVNQTGAAMLKAPALAFANDETLRGPVGETAMLTGDFLYVRPVTEPMDYGPESAPVLGHDHHVDVYLPKGALWYDFYTNERFEGGQTVHTAAPLSRIPVYVRAGAILPTARPAQSTAAQRGAPVTLTVYPGCDGRFTLYDDAGDGYGYEQGQCAQIDMTWDDAARTLTLGARRGSYPGMASVCTFLVRVSGGAPLSIAYDGAQREILL